LVIDDWVIPNHQITKSPNHQITKSPNVSNVSIVMLDVLIVGAGPAGAVAAAVLGRAGARVRIVDRAVFPRDKLCGDTVNPGTVETLRRLGLATAIDTCGLPVEGMCVTGANGVAVEGRYPRGQVGRALIRRDLDWMLLQDALAAGAQFEPAVSARGALVEDGRVVGVRAGGRGWECDVRARVTIAADGRRSALVSGLGLAKHPRRPRRWAIGAYVETPGPSTASPTLGEMHVRSGRYIGVARVPGGLTNVCLVKPWRPGDQPFGRPVDLLFRELARDPLLRERFAGARLAGPPAVLGPLAVDVAPCAMDGLLLAGDAAGFVDPMTGDGLCFAIRGAELAAASALTALANGWSGVHADLAYQRRAAFANKWRFNRAVRSLVSLPPAVVVAAAGARVAPAVLQRAIAYAGDCHW
jgi:flavin-dependent dehydrogenase